MIYAIICLVIFTSGYIGRTISLKYKSREECFCVLVKFANFLRNNIYHLSDDIENIFDKFILDTSYKYKQDFLKLKQIVLSHSFNILDMNKVSLFIELKENEKQEIFCFFKSLGSCCKESQVSLIDGFKEDCLRRSDEAVLANKQRGNIALKVSISIGVIICILII